MASYPYVILQADGLFWGSSVSTPMARAATSFPTREKAQVHVDNLRKTNPSLLDPEDPIIHWANADKIVARESAAVDALKARVKKSEAMAAEIEAAAKKDPYTAAAIETARKMEIKYGELVCSHGLKEQKRLEAAAEAHALRIENDDLRRKLARLGGV